MGHKVEIKNIFVFAISAVMVKRRVGITGEIKGDSVFFAMSTVTVKR